MEKMSIELWLPEGIHEEHEIAVSDGKIKELLAFPYRWFHVDVFNEGPDKVKVMINRQSLPIASTLKKNDGREYDAKHPKYWRVAFFAEAGKTATVRVTVTR